MHPLSCKPIASVPKLANRTPFAVVVDSFLVRTANYAVGDRDGSHLMLSDKFKNLAGNVLDRNGRRRDPLSSRAILPLLHSQMARCQQRPLSLGLGSGHRRPPSQSAIPA